MNAEILGIGIFRRTTVQYLQYPEAYYVNTCEGVNYTENDSF
jgi:hypothetical protein